MGRVQYRESAGLVGGMGSQGIRERTTYRSEWRQVEHVVPPLHRRTHLLPVADVALDELDGQAFYVLTPAGGQVIQHPHVMAPMQQAAGQVGADEAGAAGH